MIPCIFTIGMLALLAAFVAAEVAALRRWRGGWQAGAITPLAIVGFVVVRMLVDVLRDPTSHNLWPFEILLWSGVGLMILTVVAGARLVMLGRNPS